MLNVIDPKDFTEAEILGRHQVREYARFLANFVPGCEKSYVVDTGVEAGIRQTRHCRFETLRNDDVVSGRKRDDSICRVPWPIELHSGDKPKLHWLLDDYYDVSYRTLVPEVGENIIVAGRCLECGTRGPGLRPRHRTVLRVPARQPWRRSYRSMTASRSGTSPAKLSGTS